MNPKNISFCCCHFLSQEEYGVRIGTSEVAKKASGRLQGSDHLLSSLEGLYFFPNWPQCFFAWPLKTLLHSLGGFTDELKNKFFIYLFIFIFGCVGSSFLCQGFLHLRRARATLHRGARASHRRGLSRCGAQAPDAQAQ